VEEVVAVAELILHNRQAQMVDLVVVRLGIMDILGARPYQEKEMLVLDHLRAILGQAVVAAQVRLAMALAEDMRAVAEEAVHTRVQQLPMQAVAVVVHILVLHPLTLVVRVAVAAANYIMRAMEHQLQQMWVQTASAAVAVAPTDNPPTPVAPVVRVL
jgi:hypothetical protein